MKSCQMYRFIPIMLLCVCLFTGGCSQNKDQPSATHNQTPATEAASHTDHTPQVLTPQADGTKTFTTDTAVIDISHTQEGYIMAKYTGSNAKPKLQLTGTDGITYTYSLYKDYSTFPLTSGDGTYQVGVYENVSDDRYTTLLSETFSVTLTDPLKPYLYPNQYVNFTADFLPVAKAEELADGASSDLDIISSVYNYIITHTTRTLLHISTILNHYMLGFIIAFLVLLIICMILYHTDLGRVLFLGQKLAMTLPQDAFQTACIWFSPADSTVISVLPWHTNLSIIRICRHLSTNVTRISATGNHSTKHCCCPASFPRCTPAGL